MKTLVVTINESTVSSCLAKALNVECIKVKTGKFFDTETYVDIQNRKIFTDSKVIFVHQFFSSGLQSSIDQQLVELMLTLYEIKQAKLAKLLLVLPYLPYSRQDKGFQKTEPGLINFWSKIFNCLGIDEIISVDLHEPNICKTFKPTLKEIKLNDFWVNFIKSEFSTYISDKNIAVISPDKGGKKRAESIANCLNLPMIAIEKIRVFPDEPVAIKLSGKVDVTSALIIDDIIGTGKTAIQACNLLKQHGIQKVFGTFSHLTSSLFLKDAKICNCFEKIFITDTMLFENTLQNDKIIQVSISDFLVEKLRGFVS